MRAPPFSHKVHNGTGSDTLNKKPRQSNDSTTYHTKGSLDSNHHRPIVVYCSTLLSKFPPIFGNTASKGAGHLNIQLLYPPTKTDKPASEPSPTTSCFTNDSDPFRRPSPVQPALPDKQLMLPISLPPPEAHDPMARCEFVPEMQGIIQGTTRISSTSAVFILQKLTGPDLAALDPIRAFHMPTRWAPRTTQMDADPFSHSFQENPLKIILGSGALITPPLKSTSLPPTIPQIHLNTYCITTPPCSPECVSLETGDYSLSYPNYSGLDYNATHENSFDRILKDVTWEYVLYSRKHKSLKGEGEGRYGCWFGRAKK